MIFFGIFMSSSSSASSGSPANSEILTAFSEQLNIPMEASGDASKVLGIMEKILGEQSLTSSQPKLSKTLEERVTVLQSLFNETNLQSRVDAATAGILKGEMKGLLEKKVAELKPLALIEKALPELPLHRIAGFVSTVEGFYGLALSKGKAPNEALSYALGKAVVRSLIRLPSGDEIEASEELREKVKADPELEDYIDPVSMILATPDTVRIFDQKGKAWERYQSSTIELLRPNRQGGRITVNDPQKRGVMNVLVDHKAREFLDNKILSWTYPELCIEASSS